MKRNVAWGIIIIMFGVLMGVRALGILDFDIFFEGWWTLFIIVPCAVGLFTNRDRSASLIGLLIGVALLLGCQDIVSYDRLLEIAIPVIIVLIGIKIIFKDTGKHRKTEFAPADTKLRQCCATFSGQELNYSGAAFDGAELTAVFGGIKCDLRGAVIEKDALINVCAIFGGIDILLPDNVNVKTNTTSIFGGVDTKKHANKEENTVTLYINGTCMFGGVDVK